MILISAQLDGRNKGVENANGSYIAFLDADDEWLPGKLGFQVSLLDKYPNHDLVFTDSWIIDVRNNKAFLHSTGNDLILRQLTYEPIPGFQNAYLVSGAITRAIYTKSFINMSSTLLRKESFWRVGGFNIDRFGTEDIDFWVRFSRKSRFVYWHNPTARCYQGAGTSNPSERWLQELIRYHRMCLTSPDYSDMTEIAKKNLLKFYRYLIVYYGLNSNAANALRVFQDSLDLGIDLRLGLYSVMSLLGTIPFRMGQWVTSKKRKLQPSKEPLFTQEKFNA